MFRVFVFAGVAMLISGAASADEEVSCAPVKSILDLAAAMTSIFEEMVSWCDQKKFSSEDCIHYAKIVKDENLVGKPSLAAAALVQIDNQCRD